MKRLFQITLAIAIGLLVAWGALHTLAYATEEPEMRNCGTDRPLFDHPVTQSYAEIISNACRAKIERDGVIRRFDATHSMVVVAATDIVGFLLDPINLLVTAATSAIAFFGIKRFSAVLGI